MRNYWGGKVGLGPLCSWEWPSAASVWIWGFQERLFQLAGRRKLSCAPPTSKAASLVKSHRQSLSCHVTLPPGSARGRNSRDQKAIHTSTQAEIGRVVIESLTCGESPEKPSLILSPTRQEDKRPELQKDAHKLPFYFARVSSECSRRCWVENEGEGKRPSLLSLLAQHGYIVILIHEEWRWRSLLFVGVRCRGW